MIMKKMRKVLALLLVTLLAGGLLLTAAGCGKGNGPDGEATTFTYWMATSESSEYYLTYEDNPVLKYILANRSFKDKDGQEAKISLEIQHPPFGKEVDNLNTMLSTGAYTDILDLAYGAEIEDLYNEGIILDLTEYVNNKMPNYKKFIDAHPELIRYMTKTINGEQKFLTITGVSDGLDLVSQFYGICYRRDWIVKYGVQPETLYDPMSGKPAQDNPKAGQSFSGYYSLDKDGNAVEQPTLTSTTDGDSWVDDVVFPSGNADPVYISDWEWMLDIFAQAIADQAIEGGYPMSLYFPGYVANGDLVTSFGGGGPIFYVDKQGQAQFGAVTDNFKTYLEALQTWYANGWIDKQFAERSGDVFFRIDETAFRSGKVGLWNGLPSTLGSRLYNPDQPLTEGIVVYGAAQPINDIYGGDDQKLKIPDTVFQQEPIGGGIAITDKAAEKDIDLLLSFVDYLYSDEGALLRTMGLSKDQMAQAQDETYLKFGLPDGAYTVENRDGVDYYLAVSKLLEDSGLAGAMAGSRMIGKTANAHIDYQLTPTLTKSRENWIKYEATGFMGGMRNSQLSTDASQNRAKVSARIEAEYMYIVVPQFIKGEKSLAKDWDTFVADLKKRNYQSVVDDINEMLGN